MTRIFFIIILFFYCSSLFSQEAGNSFIRNYDPKEYKLGTPQNWAIIQDQRGVMYFGQTNRGICEYDGKEWRLITEKTNEQNTIRSFAIDKHGKIYAGGKSDIGVLLPDLKGKIRYHSLLKYIDEKDRNFADVFKTYAVPEGIFFQSFQSLILLEGTKYKIWYPTDKKTFHLSFIVDGKLYVRERGTGLLKLENNVLVPIKNSEAFSDERIFSMLPLKNNKILIGTQTKGIFVFDPLLETFSKDEKFKEVENYINPNALYFGSTLNKNEMAYGTFNGGVIVFNLDGQITRVINKKSGLLDDFSLSCFPDNLGNLWVGLNNGISKAEISSHFSTFGEPSGLKGGVNAIIRFENKIFAATDYGVFFLENGRFSPVAGINTQCWSLCIFKSVGEKDKLLVGTGTGIFEISGQKTKQIANYYTYKIQQSKLNNNRIYIGTSDGFATLYYNKGKWTDDGKVLTTYKFKDKEYAINKAIKSFGEDGNGDIWLGTDDNGVYKLVQDKNNASSFSENLKLFVYDTIVCKEKIPRKFSTLRIFNYKNSIIFGSDSNLFVYDIKIDKFKVPDFALTNKDGVYIVADQPATGLYLCKYNHNQMWIESIKTQGDKFLTDSISFKRLKDLSFETIFPDSAGVVWIGSNNGIFRYDNNSGNVSISKVSALIRKVLVGNDEVLFSGTFYKDSISKDSVIREISATQINSLIPSLNYQQNSLKFIFSLPEFVDESAITFSYYLEGFEKNWNSWEKYNEKEYTNLDEGSYTFHVKAKNIYGIESNESSYSFVILPPWYRTWWAYLIYVVLVSGTMWAIISLNTYRLRKDKENLEKIVKERTTEIVEKNVVLEYQKAELQQQKEEIETQRDEIEAQRDKVSEQNHVLAEQKKEITDSIHYAKRIQTAILPPEDYVSTNLPDHFILFKPRDIVSGDFYWAKYFPPAETNFETDEISERTFAKGILTFCVADCTGHGVPGAFMSMLGTAFLNEIMNGFYSEDRSSTLTAAEILNQLRDLIINSLHQTGKSGESKDGMDITFCILDLTPKINVENGNEDLFQLQCAAANNPLFIIRKDKLINCAEEDVASVMEEVKPDKMPIGIYGEEMRPFTNNIIYLKKEDMIFLASDGYQDQFGGPKGKKFMIKQLKQLFLKIFNNTSLEQKEILTQTLENWKGENEQVDDISILGMKL